MTITDIKVHLDEKNGRKGGLVGTAEIFFDRVFVVKEVKIVRDSRRAEDGSELYFLEFPWRPFTNPCHKCRKDNCVSFRFCSRCGTELTTQPARNMGVAHPINPAFRTYVTDAVLKAYAEKIG